MSIIKLVISVWQNIATYLTRHFDGTEDEEG